MPKKFTPLYFQKRRSNYVRSKTAWVHLDSDQMTMEIATRSNAACSSPTKGQRNMDDRTETKMGRPVLRQGDPTIRRSATAPASTWEYVRSVGNGNLSAGLRRLVAYHKSAHQAMKAEVEECLG